VSEINVQLSSAPETVNADPYGKGWMIAVKPTNPSEWDALLTAAQYEAFVAQGGGH
jgi:glycine cleavage system H protein